MSIMIIEPASVIRNTTFKRTIKPIGGKILSVDCTSVGPRDSGVTISTNNKNIVLYGNYSDAFDDVIRSIPEGESDLTVTPTESDSFCAIPNNHIVFEANQDPATRVTKQYIATIVYEDASTLDEVTTTITFNHVVETDVTAFMHKLKALYLTSEDVCDGGKDIWSEEDIWDTEDFQYFPAGDYNSDITLFVWDEEDFQQNEYAGNYNNDITLFVWEGEDFQYIQDGIYWDNITNFFKPEWTEDDFQIETAGNYSDDITNFFTFVRYNEDDFQNRSSSEFTLYPPITNFINANYYNLTDFQEETDGNYSTDITNFINANYYHNLVDFQSAAADNYNTNITNFINANYYNITDFQSAGAGNYSTNITTNP